MKLPTYILCTCTWHGLAVQGLFVHSTWLKTRKNPHHVLLGPTGADGVVRTKMDQVSAQIRDDYSLAMMDYHGVLTGDITMGVLGLDGIDRLLAAMKVYASYWEPYREEMTQKLAITRSVLSGLNVSEINIDVEHDGEGMSITIIQPPDRARA
jgi:hypothetical protein